VVDYQLQNEKWILLNEQIFAYKAQVDTLAKKTAVNWMVVLVAIVVGFLIDYLLKDIKNI
jgi:exodeoxyribonuclease VII large subunit